MSLRSDMHQQVEDILDNMLDELTESESTQTDSVLGASTLHSELESQPNSNPIQVIINQLQQAWINERGAPEILAYKSALVEELVEVIEFQEDNIENLREGVNENWQVGLNILILQAELDRIKYLIRVYLRTRMDKIERFALYLFTHKDETASVLGKHETEHLKSYYDLISHHLLLCSTEGLPDEFKAINQTANTMPRPNLQEAVFFRSKVSIPEFVLMDNTVLELSPGNTFLLPYSDVKNLLLRNQVDLL